MKIKSGWYFMPLLDSQGVISFIARRIKKRYLSYFFMRYQKWSEEETRFLSHGGLCSRVKVEVFTKWDAPICLSSFLPLFFRKLRSFLSFYNEVVFLSDKQFTVSIASIIHFGLSTFRKFILRYEFTVWNYNTKLFMSK